jgi:putative intracellular protease/amidase
MTATINVHGDPKRVMILLSNTATSEQTGWPIGFWWEELTDPYLNFVKAGYHVDIVSPDGGALYGDSYSDPRDASGYSADDIVSMGFIHTPSLIAQVESSTALDDVDVAGYDAVLLAGGQGPMYTFYNDTRVHELVVSRLEARQVTAVICHATAVLLRAKRTDGSLVVDGKTWTGFANSEEDVADAAAGLTIQPFRIEDEARRLTGTNFIVGPAFGAHAVRDGDLITGQQQHSGGAAAQLVIEALGR